MSFRERQTPDFMPDKGIVTVESKRGSKRGKIAPHERVNMPVEDACDLARHGVPLDIIEADEDERKAILYATHNKMLIPRIRDFFRLPNREHK